jgi:integrase
MPAETLTAAKLLNLKPPSSGMIELQDAVSRGLSLRVFSSGKSVWTYRYRPQDGTGRKRVRIGEYPAVGLSEARKRADRHRGKIFEGADPAADLKAKRNAPTLQQVIDRYLNEEVSAKRKPSTLALNEHYLNNLIAPELGSKKLAGITRADVSVLHREIGADRQVSANRAMQSLSALYTFAGRHGLVPEGYNPVRGLEKFREYGRERYLTGEEMTRLGETLRVAETEGLPWPEDADASRSKHERKAENKRTVLSKYVTGAIRLLLFTGCRLREILHLRWSEIDFERGLLLLADSKTGRKAVILNAPALEVLNGLDRLGEFVILGDSLERPRADLSRPWDLVRHHAGLADLRIHDLRHTHASVGAGSGLGLPLIGRLLGHRHQATTAKYAHLDNDPLKRASNRIGAEISAALDNRLPNNAEIKKFRGNAV